MLLGTVVASVLGNVLTGEGVKDKIHQGGAIKPGEWTIRAGQDF